MIIAGIDIGSNATRLTVSKAPENDIGFHKSDDMIKKYRFPCRLGDDVFKKGSIGPEKANQMDAIFSEIKILIEKYNVSKIKGVATSAFRDAENGKEILTNLSNKYSIPSSIICGSEEAKLMSQGLVRRNLFTGDAAHLHVDIGGGSLELSGYYYGDFLFQESLDLGTLRLVEDTISGAFVTDYLDKFKLIDEIFDGFDKTVFPKFKMHGTGGNFKRLGTLRQHSFDKNRDNILKRKEVTEMIKIYSKHPGCELSKHTPIKEENAALILPSLLMIERILNFWPAKKIKISKLSLSHVLLDELSS